MQNTIAEPVNLIRITHLLYMSFSVYALRWLTVPSRTKWMYMKNNSKWFGKPVVRTMNQKKERN